MTTDERQAMRIKTTEPISDTNGVIHPTGTEATLMGGPPLRGIGQDFETADGSILWGLVPVQYEKV